MMTETWINEYRDIASKNNVVSYLIIHPNHDVCNRIMIQYLDNCSILVPISLNDILHFEQKQKKFCLFICCLKRNSVKCQKQRLYFEQDSVPHANTQARRTRNKRRYNTTKCNQ